MIDLYFNEVISNHGRREEQDIQKKVVKRKNKNVHYVSVCLCVCMWQTQRNKMLEKHLIL